MKRLAHGALVGVLALGAIVGTLKEGMSQSGDAASAWRALSDREIQCWREVAAFQGADLSSLPAQGIFPTDPQILSIYQTCASWANGLQQNFQCQLQDGSGGVISTTCDQYYGIQTGAGYRRLTDTEALSRIIRGEGVQLIQEENASGLQARTSTASRVWEALSARETQCWEAYAEAEGSSVAALAGAGLAPTDPQLASVADTCRNWANGLPQRISCQLRNNNGSLFTTTCQQYYGVESGSGFRRLSDSEFLTMVSNGQGAQVKIVNEELPSAREARLEREQTDQQAAASLRAELTQRISELDGVWCSPMLRWECDRSFGCLPTPTGVAPSASDEIEWGLVGSTLLYDALNEIPNQHRATRSCSIAENEQGYTLSCRITQQILLINEAPRVTNEVVELRQCAATSP